MTGSKTTKLLGGKQKSKNQLSDESAQPTIIFPPLDSDVWEDIYEVGGPEEEEDTPHGSVLSHVLSQLRPGMDLTKVVLPTWILERRSLLEMFADFFVHPVEFVSIAHARTPKTRMIQCLLWYLSSFHAGRPSDVAKKPFNPIIGETFFCWMPTTTTTPTMASASFATSSTSVLAKTTAPSMTTAATATAPTSTTTAPSTNNTPKDSGASESIEVVDDNVAFNHTSLRFSSGLLPVSSAESAYSVPSGLAMPPVPKTSLLEAQAVEDAAAVKTRPLSPPAHKGTDGPCPWAGPGNVCFLAEQVSHRPPISCFYVESVEDGISMEAHVWTKSKFLGLAIGMECVGHGTLTLHHWGEEYIITFPNAYGRSILATPWFEMGGHCEISCKETGFTTKVVFHEKGLIGGKKHRVTAEIREPNEKHPFFKVEGFWNDKIFVVDGAKKRFGGGSISSLNTVFIDTKTMPIVKKKTRPMTEMGEEESRKRWRQVTWCLKNRMVDAATHYKTELEEKQRAEERRRQELDIKWRPKFFRDKGDGTYIYYNPLSKRWKEPRLPT